MCAVFQRLVLIRGQCCKIERVTGECNVSLCVPLKEFGSDEKEINFCTTMTTWFWFISYYQSKSYILTYWVA